MVSSIPKINPKQETDKIGNFITETLEKTRFKKLIIGLSGGIDSAVSIYLAGKVLSPENIFVAHLYYFKPLTTLIQKVFSELKIPPQNQYILSIQKPVDDLALLLNPLVRFNNGRRKNIPSEEDQHKSTLRKANIMARVRMILLFDLAKKHKALVLGTENKSEHLLGYFTRFGDAASDIEPISHLYKTQVYQLAMYLKVPDEIINAKPTAGLWSDQTDEGEFGFSYLEADQVIYLYFDKKIPLNKISKKEFPNAQKIINFASKNSFKLKVPYFI
ncbi:NAD(+) synthase [Candidatus Roizmanbacteria bacterium RIFCSPHIGHO2_01_FULL_35_10]|uniref:NH(3)-dependent NAD(+) synthetase n=1 Tax=Candidatus Roizmanbacteria bacterium RIFCSPLOWO2_01_FULL_35_13 TaxID=1802055 RepID=A0A1F7I787_9BACT|nr:MAG: NAD(+) synthase [Candidatus Roizmanbacteria bacterium RIFCSPHIGHO2_01_FULL_35_10]OGK39240.1 MAG: NAD(+) synthase [Candidatus Roizmanbacteria bacterium RIFCSPLOWO2_01_FULL_35_13]